VKECRGLPVIIPFFSEKKIKVMDIVSGYSSSIAIGGIIF
jgi:hypothetical protein